MKLRSVLFTLSIATWASAQPAPDEPTEPPEEVPAEEPVVEPGADEPPAEPPEPEPTAEPVPAPEQQPPPPSAEPSEPPAAYPASQPPPYSAYESGYVPPPQPDEEEGSGGFEMPPWSARIDPFNWLLEGRLGLELEVGLLDFLTVELVPTFVVQEKPPTLNLSGSPDVLRQESGGLGPMSGAAVDVGMWLDGSAFHGYVIRVGFATYGYSYRTEDGGGEIDAVDVTERTVFAMFGSQASWGAFTIAGGIGLGVELNKTQRCFDDSAVSVADARTDGCDDELQIATDRNTVDPVDLHGSLFPVELMGRFSLGILIE
jgi:hypothetical protein